MKLLIVEDELKTAEYLQKGLTEQGCAVDVAHDGIDGQHLALVHDYDVIVLDVMLPGLDGFSVLRALRARQADAGHHADRARPRSRTACAACTTAPTTTSSSRSRSSNCSRACRRCTRRGRAQEPTQLQDRRPADRPDRAQGLARQRRASTSRAKEFALLAVLARRQGEILSKTAIAELVWDMNFDSNTNVVEVAIKRLRAKIDDAFAPKLLHTIRGMGYVLEARDDDGGRTRSRRDEALDHRAPGR